MAEVRNSDLRISGGIRAGNWKYGRVDITPVANTPTSTSVSGFNLQGSGATLGYVTTVSSVPGTSVQESSVSGVSPSGMTIWVYRTNTTTTSLDWMMWRNRT